jgi:hypothetical protein
MTCDGQRLELGHEDTLLGLDFVEFVSCISDWEWDPKTKILIAFFLIYSLYIADFVFLCQKCI